MPLRTKYLRQLSKEVFLCFSQLSILRPPASLPPAYSHRCEKISSYYANEVWDRASTDELTKSMGSPSDSTEAPDSDAPSYHEGQSSERHEISLQGVGILGIANLTRAQKPRLQWHHNANPHLAICWKIADQNESAAILEIKEIQYIGVSL